MSDDANKVKEKTDVGVKRVDRARIYKQCKFTTTDIREFSHHRQHAHADQNQEEQNKVASRKNSLRRKSSVNDKPDKTDQTDKADTVEDKVTSEAVFESEMDSKNKTTEKDTIIEPDDTDEVDSRVINVNKPEDKETVEQSDIQQIEQPEQKSDPETMANEKIFNELLNSLALVPKKQSDKTMPELERARIENMKIHSEEMVLDNREDGFEEDDPESRANDTMNGEEDMGDEGELNEDEEEMVTLSLSHNISGSTPTAPVENKKRIRPEVNPLKYYEIVDKIGVKYACSKCGNVYKWRKSLNKHWKEKHIGETPDQTKPPATLQNLTLYSRYKSRYGDPPPPSAASNVVYGAAQANTANQNKARSTPTSKHEDDMVITSTPSLPSGLVMPRYIGPFISGTCPTSPLFAATKSGYKCVECKADFSTNDELNLHLLKTHSEKIQEHKEAIQKIPHGLQQTYHLLRMPLDSISGMSSQERMSNEPKQFKCSMCNFVAKWPVELQKHAVSHSEECPFICMVCASTYKWKWDLVKHFEKSHGTLPNPYKRREGGGVLASTSTSQTPPLDAMTKSAAGMMDSDAMSQSDTMDEDKPPAKRRQISDNDKMGLNVGYKADNNYRELLKRQIRAKREMAAAGRMPTTNEDKDNIIPKRNIHEALKQRLNNSKQHEEETSPSKDNQPKGGKNSDVALPNKCSVCEYSARCPSEISQDMKNHSNEKPIHCPRCSYNSKWNWDVQNHLGRCGGDTLIDTTKINKLASSNDMVLPSGQTAQHAISASQGNSVKTTSPNQPVFPRFISKSISPAMSVTASVKNLTANFRLTAGGQEHTDDAEKRKHRSIFNQGLHYCLECQFVGNSRTELQRHSLQHSELDFSRSHTSSSFRTPTPSNGHRNDMTPLTSNNNNIACNNNDKSIKLPCEWCSATFPNVVALYRHSQTAHPQQFKAQEAEEIEARQAPGTTA